ncbi:MAG TPA: hypothetical protein VK690_01100 [Stellaceae bacterium]|nr:hypothetical protein [Stellaceae bacterium]
MRVINRPSIPGEFAASALAMLDARLGRCSRCMRQSFLAAAGGLALACALTMLAPAPFMIAGGWIAAFALAALWLAHIAAFSARAAIAGRKAAARSRSAAGPWQRRRFLGAFAKTLLLVAAATLFPVSFRAASADECSCPQVALPNGVFNSARQECTCCAANQVGCTSAKKTWCCDKGHDCQGDDSCS